VKDAFPEYESAPDHVHAALWLPLLPPPLLAGTPVSGAASCPPASTPEVAPVPELPAGAPELPVPELAPAPLALGPELVPAPELTPELAPAPELTPELVLDPEPELPLDPVFVASSPPLLEPFAPSPEPSSAGVPWRPLQAAAARRHVATQTPARRLTWVSPRPAEYRRFPMLACGCSVDCR
jgi:hypothetical protein